MKKKGFLFNLVFLLFLITNIDAQEGTSSYQYPDDPAVMKKISEWQDLRFGLFMHWGPYSQWGIVESWTLCPEEGPWQRHRSKDKSYFEYVKEYEALPRTFNPVNFNPDKWAKAAKDAGMKYVVFTTKHHDGFCMFDTKYTDYKITSPSCPFSKNPKANITQEIFNSFRKQDFMIGAYFSTTDWNHNDFWWDYFPPFNRQINYSPAKYPEKWERYNKFLYNQLEELTTNYGKMDLLWFDLNGISKEKKVDWQPVSEMLRKNQPGTMMVVRYSRDQYENYRTPEQHLPEQTLDYPWETCMTMGKSWSYNPNDEYKTTFELVQTLAKIVSMGGNFLLNVGPGPDGDLHPLAYDRLEGIGKWMKINSEAIYGTKPVKPYHETKIHFTQKEDNVYAFYLPEEDEKNMPSVIPVSSMQPVAGSKVFLLGYNKPLSWQKNGKSFVINVPRQLQNKPVCENAWVFRFHVK